MIPSIHIENYKCFRDFDVELGSFTVLVGQNDSGKTAFLSAVRLLCHVWHVGLPLALSKQQLGFAVDKEAIWRNASGEKYTIRARIEDREAESFAPCLEVSWSAQAGRGFNMFAASDEGEKMPYHVSSPGQRVAYYRLDPTFLRKSVALREHPFQLKASGEGLPLFLTSLLGSDRQAFLELEKEFYALFPEYQQIDTGSVAKTDKKGELGPALRFRTRHGEELSAESVSDGAILSLAFLALTYQPNPPDILLIEEPENGVHHARLREIIDTLKHLSSKKNVQVILTTHSPYLLDLVEPEDVRVFWKDEEGAAHARPLSALPDIEEFKKHFMTGEIWTSFSHDDLAAKLKGE